ncbi:helix-turn-helix transcriptional regulator [Actinocorallia sp. A-T 12471]|uniref:helix-turn-helix domain-containing protein n=1 Tax=Actinocorallia sp. A-T 12471 TaxID=3089813 RepID=UPI0029D1B8CB|nr:helix-turn-helix transcriptional regulator [Actinocorallia sp. A-T 12471]MDX6741511.1 helix-turn-helix transcriptional regulator [Actinocorallia sp. A-T 12471]
MDDGNTIGERLKRARKERGITQEALAARAGVSVDLVSKLEQNRRTSARVWSLMALARALDVELSALTDGRDRLAFGEPDIGGGVLAVRDALLSPSLLPGFGGLDADDDGTPTPIADLEQTVAAGWDRYWVGDLAGVSALVPGLIADARLTHRSLGPQAAGPLAQAYELAASLMAQIGRGDLAAIAAERGIGVAALGDDELLWATIHGTYSWVMLRQGRLAEAETVAYDAARQIQPGFTDPATRLAAWGLLLMAAAGARVVAARSGQGSMVGHDAAEYLSMAGAAAERIGRRTPIYGTSFGAATVRMQTVYTHVGSGEPGAALEEAARVRPGDLRGISHCRHLLDVAQAQVDMRRPRTAAARLDEAERRAPAWFAQQTLARSLVADVRELETRVSPVTRRLVRAVGLD